jgi:predicted N-acyltransferase
MRRLVTIDPVGDPRWDALAAAHPKATVYHLGDFAEILHRCYGFKPCYHGLEDDQGRLVAGMPLMQTRGLYRGNRLVSLPLAACGGPLATTAEEATILLRSACEIAHAAGTRLIVRTPAMGYEELVPELHAFSEYPYWVVQLPAHADELRTTWRSSLRQNVVQSEASGLTVRDAEDEHDLRRFYRLYVRTMRRHGVLPRPYHQMLLPWKLLGRRGRAKVLLVEHDRVLLAAGFFHMLGGVMEARFVASDPRHHPKRPNHALYWDALRWAIAERYDRFNFGRVGGTLAAFKRGWGAEPVPSAKYVQTSTADEASRARAQIEANPSPAARRAFLYRRCPSALAPLAGAVAYRYLADPAR